MNGLRYTGVPDAALESLIDRTLAELASEIDALRLPCLQAVVLGGGYGRGEGGVLRTPAGNRLYNDLDFFVFTRSADSRTAARIDAALKQLSASREKDLGIAVDFGPAKNISSLKNVASTLMFQELRRGWVPVWGEADLENWIPPLPPARLPRSEAVRLLLNRGMGLIFAGEYLKEERLDPDFIVRNMNKAVLGGGDALLLASGLYRWRGEDRVEAFAGYVRDEGLPSDWASLYERAFRWKLEPEIVLPPDPLAAWRGCRDFYLACVRRCAGVPAEASCEDVARGLHRAASCERSVKNLLRWLLRARGMRPAGAMFDPPVVSVLTRLYAELAPFDNFVTASPRLLALWRLFN